MPLHPGQVKYLHETRGRNEKINILTCANRWGKSVVISCLQIWHLFYKIGLPEAIEGREEEWARAEYRTANIAPHSAMTEAVFKTINQIMTSSFTIREQESGRLVTNKCLIEWFYLKERTHNNPPYKQFFDGNVYIEHLSLGGDMGDALQGKPYGLITYDEGGRSNHLEEEVRANILPRLFDWSTQLHIISTPDSQSKSSLYYNRLYEDGLIGINNTYTQTGSLRDNTFFSKEQIQAQYDLYKDDPLRDQVLEGRFIFGGGALFDPQSITDAQDDGLNGGIAFELGHRYVIGVDTAIGQDEMVYKVVDITEKPYRQVKTIACKGNAKSPQMHNFDFVELFTEYAQEDTCHVLLETWNGESVRFYLDLPPHIQSVTRCYGAWQPKKHVTDNDNPYKPRPNAAKKADILLALRKLLSGRELKIPKNENELVKQLQIYREDDKGLPTDRVMALAMACWLANDLVHQLEPSWVSIEW